MAEMSKVITVEVHSESIASLTEAVTRFEKAVEDLHAALLALPERDHS